MLINNQYHYSYCTNIHPGEDWNTTFKNLKAHLPTIKAQVSPDAPFGIGLRLSNRASLELQKDFFLEEFKNWCITHDFYVFTMNGFPYGAFHRQEVKDHVHKPDWSTEDRLAYTLRLCDQLAFLVPKGVSGSISTSPISYKHWHNTPEERELCTIKAAKNLTAVVLHTHHIEKNTGAFIHLNIEPEPDGLIENSDEFVAFFEKHLIPIAIPILVRELQIDPIAAKKMVLKHINICYDICHFSLAYEEPKDTFQKLKKANIAIGKIQISSALKAIITKKNKDAIWDSLTHFNEPTYLHQVTEKQHNTVKTFPDIPDILKCKPKASEIRAHFHVPVFIEKFEALHSTQDQILKVLSILKNEKITEHLEVETYTWEVLPDFMKLNLTDSIIRELLWCKDILELQETCDLCKEQ